MALANYSDLKNAVASWLNRTNLTSYIPDFIALGEARIYRELRIRAMETSINSTIAAGVIAVPSDYVELKHAYVDGSPVQQLTRKTAAWIYENYPERASDGKPSFIAQDGGNFIFGPYPDSTYTIKGTYYKRFTALSDSNTTNWFMTNVPGILLFASLLEAEAFMKNDPRIELWDAKYEEEKAGIMREEMTEMFSGSPLTMSASLA